MPDSTEKKVLELLAREWRMTGPPGIMDISDIVAAVDAAPGDVVAALRDLFKDGRIDMNKLKTAAFLTPEGYDLTENR